MADSASGGAYKTNTLPTNSLWTNGQETATLPVMAERLDRDRKKASAAFGKRLQKLRDQRGLSQDSLSNATDIHSTAIGRMERGEREPRLTTILRLANGLELEPGELVNGLGKRPADSAKS